VKDFILWWVTFLLVATAGCIGLREIFREQPGTNPGLGLGLLMLSLAGMVRMVVALVKEAME